MPSQPQGEKARARDRATVKVFYDRLGEPIANELVNWFNSVHADYRSQLKELNELNFARFDAKVDQRFAELREHIERGLGEQTRWLFVAWATQMLAIIGLWIRK